MKKTYITPATAVILTAHVMPIAASLTVTPDPIIDGEGDVKSQGDWEIFDYGDE